jgi:uncharacterized protein (TIGR00266 family)
MDVRLTCSPSYTLAYCHLAASEVVMVEAGAMAAMSAGVRTSGSVGPGGIGKAVMRKALGGEGFFMARYQAELEGAWVAVAPRYPGDIAAERITPDAGMLIEQGSLLAVSQGLSVDVKYAGVRNIVLQEGVTLLRVSGDGDLLAGTYGGLQRFVLGDGEQVIVDTGHLVGFSDTVKTKIHMLGGAATSVVSGEGLVGVITGPGVVLMQTRAEQALRSWLFPDRSQNPRQRR